MSISPHEQLITDILEIGRNLLVCGAEVGRVEDTITRLLFAYGAATADVMTIVSDIEVTASFPDEAPVTRLVRIKAADYDTDFEMLEKWNALSRRLCASPAGAEERAKLISGIRADKTESRWRGIRQTIGYTLAASGFAVFFGGGAWEALFTLPAALLLFFTERFFGKLRLQKFIRVFLLSFLIGLVAVASEACSLNPGSVAIGLVMLLITGVAVTTSIRDMLTGETISGTLRLVEALLTACLVGGGLATAMYLSGNSFSGSGMTGLAAGKGMQIVSSAIGSAGFALVFRTPKKRIVLCTLGGAFSWAVYLIAERLTGNAFLANLIAGAAGTLFAEGAARVEKLPALIPLMCSIIPLVPGRSLYLSMEYLVKADEAKALSFAASTVVAAAAIAAGMVLATTIVYTVERARGEKRTAAEKH